VIIRQVHESHRATTNICLPCCHNDYKNILFPHHTPEVAVSSWQRS